MSLTKINCLNCDKETFVETREINRGNGKFCGRSCSAQFQRKNIAPPKPNVKCALCRTDFYIQESHLSNSKSGLYFCCRAHKDEAQRIGGITAIMPPHYGTAAPENSYRRIAFAVKDKVCERCGYDAHLAAIIVHHKDRNRNNSAIENLEVLCCNCHAIEHLGE